MSGAVPHAIACGGASTWNQIELPIDAKREAVV